MHFVNVVQTRTLEIVLKTVATTKTDQNLSSYVDLCKVRFEINYKGKRLESNYEWNSNINVSCL